MTLKSLKNAFKIEFALYFVITDDFAIVINSIDFNCEWN